MVTRRVDRHANKLNGLSKRAVNQPSLEYVRTSCDTGIVTGPIAVRRSNIAGEVVREGLKRSGRAAAIQQRVEAGRGPSFIHDQQSFIPIRIVGGLGELAGDGCVGYEYCDGCLRYRRAYGGRNSTRAGDEDVTGKRGILLRPNQWVVR